MSAKTGRPRTGTLEPAGKHEDGSPRFRGRLRLGDGTKSERFDVPPGLNEKQARAYVANAQALEDASGAILAAKRDAAREKAREAGQACEGEDANAWFERYLPTVECGDGHRRIQRHTWNKWIAPLIGSKPMRALTRDDVEDVRDSLDRALDEKRIRHGTARNAWSTLTGALKAAYASRDRSLRVHASPLNFGILPPKRGDGRQRPWLYPNEWGALASCPTVPVEWRQVYALAVYTGLRPNELRALKWCDVDSRARQISVSKAYDEETGDSKAPKTTAGQRLIPIEATLLPMLEGLRGADDEPVAPMLVGGDERVAALFRSHLVMAGVTRARLTADNETEEPVDFRSLRDTYATWLALAGIPDKRIQRRLGHRSATTTDRYIKAAESFDVDAIGAPFPALPEALWTRHWTSAPRSPQRTRRKLARPVGVEPTTFGFEGPRICTSDRRKRTA